MASTRQKLEDHLPKPKQKERIDYKYIGLNPEISEKLDELCSEYGVPGRTTLVTAMIKSAHAEVFGQ